MAWISQTLLYGPPIALVTCEREFRAALRRHGLADTAPWLRAGNDACTTTYSDANGKLVCLVSLSMEACARLDSIEVAALLAHEAVHVWQRIADAIGGDLGREMPAYAVQNIVTGLMRAYVKASSSACSVPA